MVLQIKVLLSKPIYEIKQNQKQNQNQDLQKKKYKTPRQ